jgi:8-oxo-dGTP pyrophosphatase MutT (NUDIX family)
MANLLSAGEPFARTSFDPGHFTASAFVLSPERDAVVLIFHKKLRIWVQPGGHAEPADTSLSAAARREVSEEIGVFDLLSDSSDLEEGDLEAPIFDVDVHPIPARRDEPAHEHFDVRFRFTARSRALRASDEVEGARWVPLSEVHTLASDESVQRAVRKLTARL